MAHAISTTPSRFGSPTAPDVLLVYDPHHDQRVAEQFQLGLPEVSTVEVVIPAHNEQESLEDRFGSCTPI